MEDLILPVGCVLMASGLSTRFGSNKLLADLGGQPLLCRAFAVMAAQGELCRRSMGYDPEELITAEQLMPRVMPGDIPAMRRAVYTAIMLGYGREVESEEDVDLVLQELQLKKKKR